MVGRAVVSTCPRKSSRVRVGPAFLIAAAFNSSAVNGEPTPDANVISPSKADKVSVASAYSTALDALDKVSKVFKRDKNYKVWHGDHKRLFEILKRRASLSQTVLDRVLQQKASIPLWKNLRTCQTLQKMTLTRIRAPKGFAKSPYIQVFPNGSVELIHIGDLEDWERNYKQNRLEIYQAAEETAHKDCFDPEFSALALLVDMPEELQIALSRRSQKVYGTKYQATLEMYRAMKTLFKRLDEIQAHPWASKKLSLYEDMQLQDRLGAEYLRSIREDDDLPLHLTKKPRPEDVFKNCLTLEAVDIPQESAWERRLGAIFKLDHSQSVRLSNTARPRLISRTADPTRHDN